MKVGMVGLGKLGLPCTVAMATKGHDVMGFDLNPDRMRYGPHPEREAGPDGTGDYNEILKEFAKYDPSPSRALGSLRFGTLQEVVDHAEVLFIAVQTPHEPRFEGITRLPPERADFDYRHLMTAIADVAVAVGDRAERDRKRGSVQRNLVTVIISTVLPGTIRARIRPLCNHFMRICYNPYFIAMGTTMRDFLNPEFVLFGSDDSSAADVAEELYRSCLAVEDGGVKRYTVPFFRTGIENAELVKVAYNTMISLKIAFANTLMEICHKSSGCNVDEVQRGLSLATWRLWSPAYTKGGMGDGGGCHPRDNIALSWLARKLDLSFDLFEAAMLQRENGTEWLADLMGQHDLPKAILGMAFKEGTALTVGSPALLLKAILEERQERPVRTWDPHVDGPKLPEWFRLPHVFLIGARHEEFKTLAFPTLSVVIDPWRFIPDQDDVEVIRVGVGPRA